MRQLQHNRPTPIHAVCVNFARRFSDFYSLKIHSFSTRNRWKACEFHKHAKNINHALIWLNPLSRVKCNCHTYFWYISTLTRARLYATFIKFTFSCITPVAWKKLTYKNDKMKLLLSYYRLSYRTYFVLKRGPSKRQAVRWKSPRFNVFWKGVSNLERIKNEIHQLSCLCEKS